MNVVLIAKFSSTVMQAKRTLCECHNRLYFFQKNTRFKILGNLKDSSVNASYVSIDLFLLITLA